MTEVGRVVDARDEAFYGALADDDAAELYENAPCAYLSTLPDGTIVKVNETFLAWSGYARHELVGTVRFQSLLSRGDQIFFETHVRPALSMQGHVREIAVDLICSNGVPLPVLVNSVLKLDNEGTPTTVRIALFDATERRAYERELLAAISRAEESEAHATTLAKTLQSIVLPHEIPEVPGLDIAGVYRPAGDGSEVGGDFYDVFEIGRDRWGLVLGDVCGKGAQAAVLASLARYTVRAEALRERSPSAVLSRLHDALLRNQPDQFCTAVFIVFERIDAQIHLTLACGGHPLPIRRHLDGRTTIVGTPGSIVGLVLETRATDVSFVLAPGESIVLYTDGVTEARRGDDFFGDERLAAIVASDADDAHALGAAVVDAAVDFQHGVTRDDIAVVAVRAR